MDHTTQLQELATLLENELRRLRKQTIIENEKIIIEPLDSSHVGVIELKNFSIQV